MNVHIKTASFQFNLKALEPLILPSYKGSTLRGGFGCAFKRVVCALKSKECSDCLLKEKCIYSYVFETPPPSDTKIMCKYKTAPHPFIIEPPPEKKRVYLPGDEITFGLTLIGRAIDYLPYFVYTFDELGKIGIGKGRGKYQLSNVTSFELGVRSEKGNKIIYSSDTKTLKAFETSTVSLISIDSGLLTHDYPHGSELQTQNSKLLTLNFLTPTRIRYNESLTPNLKFHVLIRQLLRRISLLSYFHCGINLSELDFKGIIEKAREVKIKEQNLNWYDWERYSARQDTRMKMGGVVGIISFEGDIEPFMPLIKAGEILHVGKGTSFGLGKYKIMQ